MLCFFSCLQIWPFCCSSQFAQFSGPNGAGPKLGALAERNHFPNPRRHPETDSFYQRGMTSLDLPRMVELVVAIVGFVAPAFSWRS
jgi:hypothetical protein